MLAPDFRDRFSLFLRMACCQASTTTSDGSPGFCRNLSFVKQLGPGTAIAAIDARSERSRERVMAPPSWLKLFEQIGRLPPSTRHVVIVLPSPLHYPKVLSLSLCGCASLHLANLQAASMLSSMLHMTTTLD